MIPYGKQDISQDDIDAVTAVLKSDFLTQGPAVECFERRVAEYCGAQYAVAVSSCTAALHLTYMACGLVTDKRLWTTPNTFVATANAALYCDAEIDFVDIDPQTYNMSVEALRTKLEAAKKSGTLPDIVVPVHFSGYSCDLEEIQKLSEEYGFQIIEDAAHCIGGSYKDKKIGSCAYSKACVFSFHPVKIITTGEGGLITTNDKDLYEALLRLRTHGITRDTDLMQQKDEGSWYFEQLELGYNYRITDIQCALGLSQMSRLDEFITRRRELALRYTEKLPLLPLQLPQNSDDSSWHLYVVRLENDTDRRAVFDQMRERGIGVNVHYIPVHLHPFYRQKGFKEGDFPKAENYYKHTLTLPLYPGLTEDEQDHICKSLESIL